MTVLRQRMLEDMQLRGLAAATQKAYVAAVEQLAKHYRKSPLKAGVNLRQIQAWLGQRKTCTVGVEESIRRFLQHVLPEGFAKVRHYGFFSPNQREALSKVQQSLTGTVIRARADLHGSAEPSPTTDLVCPICGKPMQLVSTLRPRSRCPPQAKNT